MTFSIGKSESLNHIEGSFSIILHGMITCQVVEISMMKIQNLGNFQLPNDVIDPLLSAQFWQRIVIFIHIDLWSSFNNSISINWICIPWPDE